MSKRGVLGLAAAVAMIGTTAACASARMRVDPALSRKSQQWDVDGANPRTWGAPLRFGPYEAASAKDGTTFGWSVPVLGASLARDHRPYGWSLAGGRSAVNAECHQVELSVRTVSSVEVDLQGASGRPALACAFRVGAGETARTWTLALSATGRASPGFRGTLRDDASAAEYEIASSHDLEGSRLRAGAPAGYLVSRGDDLVAMVETLGRGRVWMARSAGDEDVLAAAGMALLLFRPPD
jgi:hypothetical protein